MTAGEVNRELGRLDKIESPLLDRLIGEGRGGETLTETLQKDDPLSLEYRAVWLRKKALEGEIKARTGRSGLVMPQGLRPRIRKG